MYVCNMYIKHYILYIYTLYIYSILDVGITVDIEKISKMMKNRDEERRNMKNIDRNGREDKM